MQAYVGGDAAAFGQLYSRVSTLLYSYLLTLTCDESRAEKLLQTTFAKVHKARSSYIPGTPLVPWILAIARNAFLDERRSEGRTEAFTRVRSQSALASQVATLK